MTNVLNAQIVTPQQFATLLAANPSLASILGAAAAPYAAALAVTTTYTPLGGGGIDTGGVTTTPNLTQIAGLQGTEIPISLFENSAAFGTAGKFLATTPAAVLTAAMSYTATRGLGLYVPRMLYALETTVRIPDGLEMRCAKGAVFEAAFNTSGQNAMFQPVNVFASLARVKIRGGTFRKRGVLVNLITGLPTTVVEDPMSLYLGDTTSAVQLCAAITSASVFPAAGTFVLAFDKATAFLGLFGASAGAQPTLAQMQALVGAYATNRWYLQTNNTAPTVTSVTDGGTTWQVTQTLAIVNAFGGANVAALGTTFTSATIQASEPIFASVGATVTGAGIPAGTTVLSTTGNSVTLSGNASVTLGQTVTFGAQTTITFWTAPPVQWTGNLISFSCAKAEIEDVTVSNITQSRGLNIMGGGTVRGFRCWNTNGSGGAAGLRHYGGGDLHVSDSVIISGDQALQISVSGSLVGITGQFSTSFDSQSGSVRYTNVYAISLSAQSAAVAAQIAQSKQSWKWNAQAASAANTNVLTMVSPLPTQSGVQLTPALIGGNNLPVYAFSSKVAGLSLVTSIAPDGFGNYTVTLQPTAGVPFAITSAITLGDQITFSTQFGALNATLAMSLHNCTLKSVASGAAILNYDSSKNCSMSLFDCIIDSSMTQAQWNPGTQAVSQSGGSFGSSTFTMIGGAIKNSPLQAVQCGGNVLLRMDGVTIDAATTAGSAANIILSGPLPGSYVKNCTIGGVPGGANIQVGGNTTNHDSLGQPINIFAQGVTLDKNVHTNIANGQPAISLVNCSGVTIDAGGDPSYFTPAVSGGADTANALIATSGAVSNTVLKNLNAGNLHGTTPRGLITGGNATLGNAESSDYTAVTAPAALAWTPNLTCTTPGDLALSGVTAVGDARLIGDICYIAFTITATVTYTTAAGLIYINGLPYPVGSHGVNYAISPMAPTGAFPLIGTDTSFSFYACQGTSRMQVLNNKAGIASASETITTIPSGTQVIMSGSGWYRL